MVRTQTDLFKRLPPELRIRIYELVLVSDRPLRRIPSNHTTGHLKPATQPMKSFAGMLEVSKYVYWEAFDSLYNSNVFRFENLVEATDVQPAAFCEMRDIVVVCTEDAYIDELDEMRMHLCALTAARALRARDGKVALRTVTVTSHALARYIDRVIQYPYYHGKSVYADTNIGLWTSPTDQTFAIRLEHTWVNEFWFEIISIPRDGSGFEMLVDFEIDNMPNNCSKARLKRKTLLRTIALDLLSGVCFTHPGWHTRDWAWVQHLSLQWYVGLSEDGSDHDITEGLKDARNKFGSFVIGWANNVFAPKETWSAQYAEMKRLASRA
ncbi:hypothetical protein LTR17_017905 [Elasticomyces elasticus]|nr:hypothetical protein LTR17_017905 [Elasticomyces elasticus]